MPESIRDFCFTLLDVGLLTLIILICLYLMYNLGISSNYEGGVHHIKKIVNVLLFPLRKILPKSRTRNVDLSPYLFLLVLFLIRNAVGFLK